MRRLGWIIAAVLAAALMLAGCGKVTVDNMKKKSIKAPIENEYIKINKVEGLELERVKPAEVTDEMVETEIQSQLEGVSTSKTEVPDRPIKKGDTILLDCSAKGKDGKVLEGTELNDYELEIGSGVFIPGWEDACIGKPYGKAFTFDLKFPEGYGSEEMSGQNATWTVTAKGLVTGQNEAKLDNETVKKLSKTAKTVDEYKAEVKKTLEEENKTMSEQQLQQDVWEAIEKETEVKKYPQDRIDAKVKEAQESYKNMAKQYGMSYEEMLEQYGMKEEDLNNQMKQYAEETLKTELIVDLVLEKLGLEPSDEDYQDMYKDLADKYGYGTAVDTFLKAAGEDEAKLLARQMYVTDWLIAHADIKDVDQKKLEESEDPNANDTVGTVDEDGEAQTEQQDKAAGDSIQ